MQYYVFKDFCRGYQEIYHSISEYIYQPMKSTFHIQRKSTLRVSQYSTDKYATMRI
jgi:hypothetical protein